MSVSIREQSDRVVRISDEADYQLIWLAKKRGGSKESLVEEAIALLFHQHVSDGFKRSEQDILHQLFAETGTPTARSVPCLLPEDIDLVVPVPCNPARLKRPGDDL